VAVALLKTKLAMLPIEKTTPLIHRQYINCRNIVHLVLFRHPEPVHLPVMHHPMNQLCISKVFLLAKTIRHTLSKSSFLEQSRVHVRRVYPFLREAHLLTTYLHRRNTGTGKEWEC
jgi:hypothetical protein